MRCFRGMESWVDATNLVPGDVIVLDAGDKAPRAFLPRAPDHGQRRFIVTPMCPSVVVQQAQRPLELIEGDCPQVA